MMKIRPVALEIDSEDPFASDSLNRRKDAKVLTHLLKTSASPFVMAINAQYGAGKSNFVRMWKVQLELEGFQCVYFNAWESDFSDDPLISLFGEFRTELERHYSDDAKSINQKVRKASKLVTQISLRAIPLAAKLMSQGLVDPSKVGEAIGGFVGDVTKDGVESYISEKRDIAAFRDQLVKLVALMDRSPNKYPLLFFVDELDRCKPHYAINLLERMKHLFEVEGIVFVLSVDKGQLISALRGHYGAGLDGDGYLRRFIDLEYNLPDPPKEQLCRQLIQRFGLDETIKKRAEIFQDEADQLIDTMAFFSRSFGLTPRAIVQSFAYLNIAMHSIANSQVAYLDLGGFLLCIKAHDPDMFRHLRDSRLTSRALIDQLRLKSDIAEFFDSPYGGVLEGFVLTAFSRRPHVSDVDVDSITPGPRRELIKGVLLRMTERNHCRIGWSWIERIEIATPFTVQ